MSGETDLGELLRGMSPALHRGEYTFESMTEDQAATLIDRAWMMCREDEGVTVIMPVDEPSSNDIADKPRFCRITLRVHSSLHAVGLTAAVSHVLADHQIPANMVAGFFHDHVFVPSDRANDAMTALASVTHKAAKDAG